MRDRSSPAQDTSSPAVPSLDAGGSSTADSVDYAGRQDQAGSTASVTTGSSAEIILDLSKGTHGQKTSRNRWPKPKREPPLNPEELAIREHGGSAFPSNETDYGAGVGLRREAAMEQTNEWDAPGGG